MKVEINVEIKSADVRVQEGVARRTGRPYKIAEQCGWAYLGKPYPQEVRWLLADGSAPLPVGRYVLREDAVSVDRNGSIVIDFRRMQPLKAAA